MKKELKRKKDEQLWQWHERLAMAYGGRKLMSGELRHLLHDVSVEGYIEGVRMNDSGRK